MNRFRDPVWRVDVGTLVLWAACALLAVVLANL